MTDPIMVGSCLCGGVTVSLPRAQKQVGICHCESCRRWCSGPWMAIQAPDAEIRGDSLRVFQSSMFAERGFCAACGSAIFHRPQDGPERAISAGLFDPDQLAIAFQICIDRKPAYYSVQPETDVRTTSQLALEWAPKLLLRRLKRILRA